MKLRRAHLHIPAYFFLCSLGLGSSACSLTKKSLVGPVSPSSSTSSSASTLLSGGITDVQAFQTTLYPVTTKNCASCHSVSGNGMPAIAATNVNTAYQAALPFVNFTAPSSSVIVIQSSNGHCGTADCQNNGTAMVTVTPLL